MDMEEDSCHITDEAYSRKIQLNLGNIDERGGTLITDIDDYSRLDGPFIFKEESGPLLKRKK